MPVVDGLLTQPCTLHVATGETASDYGDPVITYEDVESVCSLQQATRREPADAGEFAVSDWRLFLPAGVNLGQSPTANRVTVNGETFEFVGDPWPVWDPWTRQVSHVEATVRKAS